MIYTTIDTPEQFADYCINATDDSPFSYDAWTTLFGFYEDAGEDIECDPVALRCDWAEYATVEELQEAYTPDEGVDVLDYLEQNTTVLLAGTGYLVQEF